MMKMNWLFLLLTTLLHIYKNVSGTLYYEYSKNDLSPPRIFLSVDKKLNSDGLTICLRFFQHQSGDDIIHLIDNGKHKNIQYLLNTTYIYSLVLTNDISF